MFSWLVFVAVCTIVLSVGFVLAELLFYRRPAMQDLVWRSCLVALYILPLFLLCRPWSAQLEVTLPQSLAASTNIVDGNKPAVLPEELDTPQATSAESAAIENELATAHSNTSGAVTYPTISGSSSTVLEWSSLAMLGLATWFAGASVKLLHVATCWYRLRVVSNSACSYNDNHWQSLLDEISPLSGISVKFSPKIQSPMVGNGLRRIILVPDSMQHEQDKEFVRQILSHELAHFRRNDYSFGLLMSIAGAVLWFHPLCYWMSRRLVWLREVLCDAQVAKIFGVVQYAETLLKVAASQHSNTLEMAMVSSQRTLRKRVHRLLTVPISQSMPAGSYSRITAWLFIANACAGLALIQVQSPAQISNNDRNRNLPQEVTLASHSEKPETRQTMSGKVFMPDGALATKSTVYLVKRLDQYTLPVRAQETAIDEDGRFQFADLSPGKYLVWAETEQYTSLTGWLKGTELVVGDTDSEVDLKLLPACNYKVIVRDKNTQQPIPDARIDFGWTDIARSYQTDQNGVAIIGGLPPNEWYFRVQSPKHGTEFLKTPQQPTGSVTELVFQLDHGSKLEGRVVDQDGKPIVNCKIYSGRDDMSMTPGYGTDKLRTDADGRFQISSLPRDVPLYVACDANNYERFKRIKFTIASDQEKHELEIKLKKLSKGGSCIVHVTDEDNQPISGARVINHGNSTADKRVAKTDETGLALLNDVFTSRYDGTRAAVWAKGFIPKEVDLIVGSPEEPGKVSVTLEKGHTIRGRIVNADGQPGSSLRIFYNGGENAFALLGGTVVSDKDGRFEIDGLPIESRFTIRSKPPHAPFHDQPLPVGDGKEVVVQLELEGVIRIRAIDKQSNQPIPEFNVKLGFTLEKKPDDPAVHGLDYDLIETGKNILGDVKEFRHGQLMPGTPLQVTVSAAGYNSTKLGRVEAKLESEGEVIDVPLEKEDPSQFQQVSGKLLDANSNPVKGATIVLVSSAKSPRELNWSFYHWDRVHNGQLKSDIHVVNYLQTATNTDGEFLFPKVKEASWTELFVFGQNVVNCRFLIDLAELKQSGEGLLLEIPQPARLKITVDRNFWNNAHSISLMADGALVDAAFGCESYTLDSDTNVTSITLDNLPPNKFSVLLQGKPVPQGNSGFSVKTLKGLTVTLEEGDEKEVEF